ncbi:MAG: cytochrome C oxidase subunit IV family protein, partial [Bacteroidota bacterium]
MSDLSYEDSKKQVFFGLKLLAVVTLIEVAVSLFGKGWLVNGIEEIGWLVALCALIIVALSVYKAYFIIYEFMHMRYEMKGLAYSVLLPTALLIWAIIAFFQEGNSWKERRELIKDKNAESINSEQLQGNLIDEE